MDFAFLLDDVACSNFLQLSLQSFDCTYICLWSYLPLPRICLIFKDGLIRQEYSPASRLFNEYRKYQFDIQNDRVPGAAFKNSLPYLELKQLDLQRLASIDVQREFYQEAKIKSAIFLGCQNGEIELGFSSINQMNMDMEIKNRFMQDILLHLVNAGIPQQSTKQNHQLEISSSSSYISDEVLYGERQSFDEPNTCHEPMLIIKPVSSTNFPNQHRQSMQQVGPFQDFQLPPPLVIEDSEMTRPVLIISPTTSPSSTRSLQLSQNLFLDNYPMINQEPRTTKVTSAFKKYGSVLGAGSQVPRPNNVQGQRMFKRAISYLKSINLRTIHERYRQGNAPKINQLHHMISERRRREKLNDHFEALRSLLPLGSKKDKASVLKKTKEYLTSLQAQVSELSQRNQALEARVSPMGVDNSSKIHGSSSGEEKGSADFWLSCESTSKDGVEEIKVTVGGDCQMMDLTIRALEFLKRDKNVSLISMEAVTLMAESSSNSIVLRLKIEGGEWDELAFEEALKRSC